MKRSISCGVNRCVPRAPRPIGTSSPVRTTSRIPLAPRKRRISAASRVQSSRTPSTRPPFWVAVRTSSARCGRALERNSVLSRLSGFTAHAPSRCIGHPDGFLRVDRWRRPRRYCSAIHEKPCEPDAIDEHEPTTGAAPVPIPSRDIVLIALALPLMLRERGQLRGARCAMRSGQRDAARLVLRGAGRSREAGLPTEEPPASPGFRRGARVWRRAH